MLCGFFSIKWICACEEIANGTFLGLIKKSAKNIRWPSYQKSNTNPEYIFPLKMLLLAILNEEILGILQPIKKFEYQIPILNLIRR